MPVSSCLLFFPGDRPDLLTRALASSAGLVCADLEDAVTAAAKDDARAAVLDLLRGANSADRGRIAVRINHPSSAHGMRDLEALVALGSDPQDPDFLPHVVVVPKAAGEGELDAVRKRLSTAGAAPRLIPIVETAVGLASVERLATVDGVAALLFGGLDLSRELGCELDWEPLLYARSRCVLAARLAGIGLLDTPFFDLDDREGLESEARAARKLGFTGKAAIHPAQVPVIDEVFTPTGEEIAAARRLIEAYEGSSRGAFALDGMMVDRPVIEAARSVLSRAESMRRAQDDRG